MRVLYDHQIFTLQNFGGISRYFCEIIRNRPAEEEVSLSIIESDNIYLKDYFSMPDIRRKRQDYDSFANGRRFIGRYYVYNLLEKAQLLKTPEAINKKACIKDLRGKQFDIFHPTYYDDYFLPFIGKKPFVLTIHDMIPELFPQQFKGDKQAKLKKKLAHKAEAIVAVSENTKKDIVDILGIDPGKIHVIYHGGPNIEVINSAPLVKKPYFLFVGRRSGYKNFEQVLLSFAEIHKKYKDISLVCTGDNFEDDEKKRIEKLGLESHIVHITAQDDSLKNLYANSIALLFPSSYEGFGLPILEAYAYGCPVILNKASCFPEIADDAAIWYSENSHTNNMLTAMEHIINMDTAGRNELISSGYKRLELFSWKSSSQKLFNLYSEITGIKL